MVDYLIFLLMKLEGVKQRVDKHPEIDALNHSLQVFYHALRETEDKDLILAALLHDVGKYENTLGHDRIAADWLDGKVPEKTLFLIAEHIRFKTYLNGELRRKSKADFFSNHKWIRELVMLTRFDMLGRNPNKKIKFDVNFIGGFLMENYF
jgi:predicted HD phosphohydrolase